MNYKHPVRVALLLPDQAWAGSVYLARELLQVAGTLISHNRDVAASALFEVSHVAASRAPVASFGGALLKADWVVGSGTGRRGSHAGGPEEAFQVIILPTQFAPEGTLSASDRKLAPWIAAQHAAGALVVSLGGAVLLAKSGLLEGRQATGVRSEAPVFARFFPGVRYTPSRQIVVDGNILCAGGIAPTADVVAHVVQRFYGRRAAQTFLRHTTTGPLPSPERVAVWSAQFRQHQDRPVLAVQDVMERDIAHLPTLAQLAARVALSERTLSRRFAAAVGMGLRQYAALCRLELAQALLRGTREPLTHIADQCGYATTSALVHAFTARNGVSPLHYRRQVRTGEVADTGAAPAARAASSAGKTMPAA